MSKWSFIRNLLSDKTQKGEKQPVSMAKSKKENDFGTGIPKDVMESLARALLPEIRAFYESEEGKEAFEKWKAERERSTD